MMDVHLNDQSHVPTSESYKLITQYSLISFQSDNAKSLSSHHPKHSRDPLSFNDVISLLYTPTILV